MTDIFTLNVLARILANQSVLLNVCVNKITNDGRLLALEAQKATNGMLEQVVNEMKKKLELASAADAVSP
jgi:hypothetical protein